MSQFRDFCTDQGLYARKGDGRTATHYLLDGGKLHVHDEAPFLSRLARSLWMSEHVYLVEVRTPVFRLYVDLDFLETEARPPEARLREVVATIRRTVAERHHAGSQCVTLGAADKVMEKGGERYVKTGLHVVFPDLYVTVRQALWIRSAVVSDLVARLGERPAHNPWADVYDACVYKGNGLRMPGCRKADRCRACQKEVCRVRQEGGQARLVPCSVCGRERYLDKGRPYTVRDVLGQDGEPDPAELERLASDFRHMLERTHVRSARERPTVEEDELFGGAEELPIEEERGPGRSGGRPGGGRAPRSSEASEQFGGRQALADFLAGHFPEQMALATGLRHWGRYVTVSSESRMCRNVGREHNGNHTYVHVTVGGCQQRCHCSCDTLHGRRFGLCRDYSSPTVPLPSALARALFPSSDMVMCWSSGEEDEGGGEVQERAADEQRAAGGAALDPELDPEQVCFVAVGSKSVRPVLRMMRRRPAPPKRKRAELVGGLDGAA